MSAQPSQNGHRRFGSRTSSRSMLASEVNMINRYARKYSTQYKSSPYQAAPYQAVSPAFSSGKPADDSMSSVSSKMSSVSKPNNNGNNNNNNNNNSNTVVMHGKRPSNLIHPQNHGLWNENAMTNQHRDMESAMETMIASYQTRLEKQQHFLDDIEREAAQNKNFGKLENCDDWSNLEVCHWLTSIHLEKYIQSFADQIIDGSILIRDLDESILIQELGVKRIHVKKIMREIAKLRDISPKFSKKNDSKDALVQSLKLEIQSLQRENKHLRDQIKSLQNQTNAQDITGSHFSSNTSSMSSIQSSAYNNNNNNNNNNNSSNHNNGNSSSNNNVSKYGNYGSHASHNYTVNPRSYKKY